ncbi:PREDICTED: E3 ubiquitin-protein ligase PUB23-like [Ipomoea nil]|uniref:E3 ubiquitin-protein ligase PUB23-like n=1 Tax=Ipomoea nil TaxID=35883 RepID=UPI000901C79B|nr:PREDICTED: E3 ubiquitin-protein ligase PUB23-like [Ipomoea nil]
MWSCASAINDDKHLILNLSNSCPYGRIPSSLRRKLRFTLGILVFSRLLLHSIVADVSFTSDDELLTPNVTLRRVIQSWCTLHASHGVERFPTPKPPVTKSHILKLLRQAKSTPEMHYQVVQILRDNFSCKASKSALHLLANVCQRGRNRIKAAEAGAATVLIDLLLDTNEKRYCEWSLSVLEHLCRCAEGRAELLKHAAGLAVVSRKILRVSQVANERGLRILYFIAKFSATPSVVQEMLQLGVGAKLCLVIQVDCGVGKNKERAAEILKLHAKEWKKNIFMLVKNYSVFSFSAMLSDNDNFMQHLQCMHSMNPVVGS